MRRRMVLAQLAMFGLVSVLIVTYTTFTLLGVKLTDRPYTVVVQLATGGGIFDGAEVTYRGVHVGRVRDVDLGTGGVTLRLAVDHGTRIPADAVANVHNLSAVGEQYVDLVPAGRSRELLRDGSVIPAARTTTPLQVATVLYDLERFVDSLNPADLRVIGRELAAAFAGTAPELKALLSGGQELMAQLTQTQDATLRLLHNSSVLLRGAAAHADDFTAFATSLKALTSTLAASTPDLDRLLEQAAPTTSTINDLLSANASALGVLLANLATLSEIQVARVPALQALLVAVPEFGRRAPTIVKDGVLQVAGVMNHSQPLCPSGVPMTSPISGKRTPVTAIRCDLDVLPRGAANAPGPTSALGTRSLGPAALPTSDGTAQVGGYDPASGLTVTGDGTLIRLGSTGGQQRLLGDASWKALLLAATGG